MSEARVLNVCISEKKGTRKHPVDTLHVIPDHGAEGDAHAGNWHRQISLLANESVDKMRASAPQIALHAGDFAENILTEGIDLKAQPVGSILRIGAVKLEVTQIGKECHADCEIRRITGNCVMPTEGIFAKVLNEGEIRAGDRIITEAEPAV